MSRLLLNPLPSIPVSGATERDGEHVIGAIKGLTDLYKSGVKIVVDDLIENLPLDHRARSVVAALHNFLMAADEICGDLEGAIEQSVERES